MRHPRELMRLATVGRHDPELWFSLARTLLAGHILRQRLALSVGNEGEPSSIRRPCRAVRVGDGAGKAARLATRRWNHPDRRTVSMFAPIDGRIHIGHAP